MATYLKTYTGHHIDPLDPKVDEIELRDIAHALSLICRGNGQTTHFYSVGQHCINCALEARERKLSVRVQLICLLHDASEAYIADLIRPVKAYMEGYQKIEDRFLAVVLEKFGLGDMTLEEWEQVRRIDDDLLAYDLTELLKEPMPEGGYHCLVKPELGYRPFGEVEEEYIGMAQRLMEECTNIDGAG